MRFYQTDKALEKAIIAADKPVRLKVEIDVYSHFESVFEHDIIEANFYSLKEAAGGVSSRGELLLDNLHGVYSYANVRVGTQVNVSFSIGEGLPFFKRFVFYVDDKGIQDIRGEGRKRFVRIGLRDLSARLRKTDEARDWTTPAVFTYSVVSDNTQPEKSLVHGIAGRAGLTADDIDSTTISVTLPFVRLRRNVWAELSSLAVAYRCHLECTPDKPLVFINSPYQVETLFDTEIAHTFTGEDIYYFRKIDRAELYRNTVRLKVNMPVALEKQEIWRYDEPPVLFDENMQAFYPFRYSLVREIETGNYEANYKVIDSCGRERNVVFADEIDTKEEAEKRLEYISSGDADDGGFSYTQYDVVTNFDKARLTLEKEADGDLYNASIYGRPIVLDLNRSSFMRNAEEVALFGTVVLNVTGSYFSEYVVSAERSRSIKEVASATNNEVKINGISQYEDWVIRELAERIQQRREFTVKTHRGLFNARVGARVNVSVKNEQITGLINALSFRYRRTEAFVATFRLIESRGRT